MTPTAREIVSSPAWRTMQDMIGIALYEQFQRTPPTDTAALIHLRQMRDVMDEIVGELERMARAK